MIVEHWYTEPFVALAVVLLLIAMFIVQGISGDRAEDHTSTVPEWRYPNAGKRTDG